MRKEALEQVLGRTIAELSECLTDQGQRDLRQTRLTEMEDEVGAVGDELIRRLLTAVLERQAGQTAETQGCPRCGGPLAIQSDQATPLQTRRGKVHWRQPVRRCGACRRDFFPSGESTRL